MNTLLPPPPARQEHFSHPSWRTWKFASGSKLNSVVPIGHHLTVSKKIALFGQLLQETDEYIRV